MTAPCVCYWWSPVLGMCMVHSIPPMCGGVSVWEMTIADWEWLDMFYAHRRMAAIAEARPTLELTGDQYILQEGEKGER